MPTRNRGKHANDDKLFNDKWKPIFKEAVKDLSYLLSRNYGSKAATQIVGNRYRLNARQQKVLLRMTASETSLLKRKSTHLTKAELKNKIIIIDGFNLLILLESTLSNAYVFKSQDNLFRDMSSVHGSYKSVFQTEDALVSIGEIIKELEVKKAIWYFDSPVSNSGKMKKYLLQLADAHNYNWEVHLDINPDKVLVESEEIVVTSDAWILDNCNRWFNLGKIFVERFCEQENVICAV